MLMFTAILWFTLPAPLRSCNRAVVYSPEYISGMFEEPVVLGNVDNLMLDEISGVAASRRHRDILYVLNDSGNSPRVFAVNATNGKVVATFNIRGSINCDWEDIAVGPGPYGQFYIYIGDIGGNRNSRCDTIYRVREPLRVVDSTLEVHGELRYQWQESNCETMMVDQKGNIFLLAKIDANKEKPRLYQVPNFAWRFKKLTLHNGTAVEINLEAKGPTGGDISINGKEILIRTYNYVYYWRRHLTTSVRDTMSREPIRIPRTADEPQGEAICWDRNGDGFFTVSEGPFPPLYYYAKGPSRRLL